MFHASVILNSLFSVLIFQYINKTINFKNCTSVLTKTMEIFSQGRKVKSPAQSFLHLSLALWCPFYFTFLIFTGKGFDTYCLFLLRGFQSRLAGTPNRRDRRITVNVIYATTEHITMIPKLFEAEFEYN